MQRYDTLVLEAKPDRPLKRNTATMNTSKQLFTHISSDGELTLSLVEVDVPKPKAHEIVVKMKASPINPSDMWPMFGPANLSKALLSDDKSVLTAPLYPGMLSRIKLRLDQTLPIGNEGAGVVVAAGDSEQAQALMGKTVALF